MCSSPRRERSSPSTRRSTIHGADYRGGRPLLFLDLSNEQQHIGRSIAASAAYRTTLFRIVERRRGRRGCGGWPGAIDMEVVNGDCVPAKEKESVGNEREFEESGFSSLQFEQEDSSLRSNSSRFLGVTAHFCEGLKI